MKNSKFIQTEHIKGVLIILDRTKPKNCPLCDCELSTPHQCKRCKRMICEKCGPHKAIIYDSDKPSKQAHRICSVCKDEKDSIKQFIEFQHIQFNRDSISIEWLNIYQTDIQACIQNYEKAKQNAQKKSAQQQFDISKMNFDIVFAEIQQLINYSLKDFFLLATNSVPIQQQKGLVIGIIDTLLKLHPEIGYCPDLVLITYFLLCFSSEPTAYILLTIIYGYIVPAHLYHSNINLKKYAFENEVEIVMGIVQESLKPNQQDGILIKSFIQNRIFKYIASLGINFFQVETQIYIFNQLFSDQRNFNSFLKCLAAAIECNNIEIKSNSINYDYTELSILRNLKVTQLNFQHQYNKKVKVEKYTLEVPQMGSAINTKQLSFNSLVGDQQQADQIEFLKLLEKTKHQEQIIQQKEEIIQNLQEQNKVQDMGKLIQKVQELEFQAQQYFNEKSQLQEQLKNQQTNNATQSKVIQKELSTLQQHNTNCESSILKLESSIQRLSTENLNLNTKLKQLTENSDQKLQTVNDRLIEDNLKLENNIISLKKQNADQKEQYGQLQIQLQVLQLQIQEKQSQILQNDEQILGLNENIIKLQSEIESFKLKNVVQIKPQNNELNDQISRLQAQLQLAEAEILSLNDLKEFSESQRIELEDQLDEQNLELRSLRQLDNQQELKLNMETEINKLKQELENVNQMLQTRQQELEEALIKIKLFDQLKIESDEANQLSQSKAEQIAFQLEEFRQKDILNSKERKTEIDEFTEQIQNSAKVNESLKQELSLLQMSHELLVQKCEIQKQTCDDLNKQIQAQVQFSEEQISKHQFLQGAKEQLAVDYQTLQQQYDSLISENILVQEKKTELENQVRELSQNLLNSETAKLTLQEQNIILNKSVENLKYQIESLNNQITVHLGNINDVNVQSLQLQLTISALETKCTDEIKLREELQDQIERLNVSNNTILQEIQDQNTQTKQLNIEMEKINTEFEKQGLLVNELNARKYQLEREVSEQQKIIEQEVEKQREITLVFEQQIAQLEERRLQQDQALKQLKQEFSEKVQEYEEQISLLQLADERNQGKLEQQSQVVEQLAELQIVKQSLDKQIKKYLNEIEQLKSQLESNKESADTGSMEYQNSITQQLQAKNEEISMLGDLNSELVMKSEELENRIKDFEIQVNNQQKALKEQHKLLEDQQFTQEQLLRQLNEIPSIKPELFQFSDSNNLSTKAKDQEDYQNVLEIKSFQNQILKGLLKDNQQQIQQLTQTLLSFKNILISSLKVVASN